MSLSLRVRANSDLIDIFHSARDLVATTLRSSSSVCATVPNIRTTVPSYETDGEFGVMIGVYQILSASREITMNRRTFLATTAVAAAAATMKAASAATVTPIRPNGRSDQVNWAV